MKDAIAVLDKHNYETAIAEVARLNALLEKTLPILAAAAAGASVQIAAADVYRETRAALGYGNHT